jgi:hypothetical protein
MRNSLIVVVAVLATLLIGCQTPSSSPGMNPATTGGPAIAAQGAQTIGGDQGQTPQTGTSGTASQSWYFASQGASDVMARILELADKHGWTAEQVASALASANGAPESVEITTGDQNISTGTASPVGATTGGGSGQAGGSTNQITKP